MLRVKIIAILLIAIPVARYPLMAIGIAGVIDDLNTWQEVISVMLDDPWVTIPPVLGIIIRGCPR